MTIARLTVHFTLPARLCAMTALITLLPALTGCSSIEKAPPQPKSARAQTKGFTLDVPEIMRGTVAAETLIRGYQAETSPGYRPMIASGYGLVVGLKGTGSRMINPQLRQYMLQEASRGGFGDRNYGEEIGGLSPEQLIGSPDTAVVLVQAIIPQGAPAGTRFDVRVSAAPGTDTQSLEGGRLYTTLLRPGPVAMGGRQAFEIARAHGPIFVNPFTEPGAIETNSTVGRVLNGGEIIKDMPLKLQLANPSHARAMILQTAINTRFPLEPNQRQATARGESEELIDITVPPSWADYPEEFVKLLMHTTLSVANPEATALYVKRTLMANPAANAEPAALRWQALGVRALSVIKDLYDYHEELPRVAALQAGARLNDGLVIGPLIQMAETGTTSNRLKAIELLERLRTNPRIDLCLRALLDEDDVEIRLRAYEALVERGDPYMDRYNVDNKFVLDVVKSSKPLIYITQLHDPRIAVFGDALQIDRPLTVSAWSNRLMIKGDADDTGIDVLYRDVTQPRGVVLRAKPDLREFVMFLAHKTSVEEPAPGLNLTYSETVNALHHIWQQRYIKADFKLEQDRILAAIRRIEGEHDVAAPDRPEFSTPEPASGAGMGGSDIGRLGEAPAVAPANSPDALPGTGSRRQP